jgi:NitT/TauT family transport system permease protein
MFTRHRAVILKLCSALLVFGSWEIAGRIPVSFAFPTFFESLAAFWALIIDGTMFRAYAETLRPLVIGVLISGFLGIAIGLWIGLNRVFDWLVSPSKVFVVCIMAMPVIVLNTAGAVRNTPASLIEMGNAFLGTRRDIILKIILPSASPVIFAGLRLGVSAGFIGAILAELKITPTGVGDIISYSRSIADYPSMYAAIASIIVLAVVFLNLLERLEGFLFMGARKTLVSD